MRTGEREPRTEEKWNRRSTSSLAAWHGFAVSVSVCHSGPGPAVSFLLHQARKRLVYCAWGAWGVCVCVWERERERERERKRDGSDVTKIALKLVMSSHFPLQKYRTFLFAIFKWWWSIHLPNGHALGFFFLKWSPLALRPWHWHWVHTFRYQKKLALFIPRRPLSNGATSYWRTEDNRTNDGSAVILAVNKRNQN